MAKLPDFTREGLAATEERASVSTAQHAGVSLRCVEGAANCCMETALHRKAIPLGVHSELLLQASCQVGVSSTAGQQCGQAAQCSHAQLGPVVQRPARRAVVENPAILSFRYCTGMTSWTSTLSGSAGSQQHCSPSGVAALGTDATERCSPARDCFWCCRRCCWRWCRARAAVSGEHPAWVAAAPWRRRVSRGNPMGWGSALRIGTVLKSVRPHHPIRGSKWPPAVQLFRSGQLLHGSCLSLAAGYGQKETQGEARTPWSPPGGQGCEA